jgi:hypothetical protein
MSSGLATGARIFSISSARMVLRPRSSSCSNFRAAMPSRMRLLASGPEIGSDQRLLDIVEGGGI